MECNCRNQLTINKIQIFFRSDPSLVGAYFLHTPQTLEPYFNNDSLYNGTCYVTGGAQRPKILPPQKMEKIYSPETDINLLGKIRLLLIGKIRLLLLLNFQAPFKYSKVLQYKTIRIKKIRFLSISKLIWY